MFGGIRCDYDLPAITRGRCGVHDQHACRTAALGFFVLVGPAAVVRHRLTAEEIGLRRWRRRIVYKNEQYFAANVGTLEVIPPVLGSGGAVADENELAVCAAGFGGR